MSDDFVTRLGLQLQEAAERDMRRSAPSRALRGQRWLTPALAGAIALAVVVAAVAAATLWLRGDATPLPAQPRVVATLHVTDNPVQIVDAFGSIWIADHVAGRILRLDPATGAVQATIRVRTGNWLWITAGPRSALGLRRRAAPDPADRPGDEPRRRPHAGAHTRRSAVPGGQRLWRRVTTSGRSPGSARCGSTPPAAAGSSWPTRRAPSAGSSSATTPCGRSASATRCTGSTRARARAGAASRPGCPARRGSRRWRAPSTRRAERSSPGWTRRRARRSGRTRSRDG